MNTQTEREKEMAISFSLGVQFIKVILIDYVEIFGHRTRLPELIRLCVASLSRQILWRVLAILFSLLTDQTFLVFIFLFFFFLIFCISLRLSIPLIKITYKIDNCEVILALLITSINVFKA